MNAQYCQLSEENTPSATANNEYFVLIKVHFLDAGADSLIIFCFQLILS